MGLFGKRKKQNETAVRLDGRELDYLARRYTDGTGNPQEDGLGHTGRIDTANGHIILLCEEREVFVSHDPAAVECGETMALDGAIFTGYNEVSGRTDSIIVHYKGKFRR